MRKNSDGAFLLIGLVAGIIITLTFTLNLNEIKPIHVYQGKTTLEYKVVNGVKVDSCVIWKEIE